MDAGTLCVGILQFGKVWVDLPTGWLLPNRDVPRVRVARFCFFSSARDVRSPWSMNA
jgi:hypothetical protein